MTDVSYDVVFLQGALAPFYPSGWALLAVAAAVAAAGSTGRAAAAGRTLCFTIAFVIAYLLLHLYGTGVGAFLGQHRLPVAIGVAAVLLLEGLSVVGVNNLWAVVRGRGGTVPAPATDHVTAAVLGAGMAFAASLLANTQALARAAELGDAGRVALGASVTAAAVAGTSLALLLSLHLLQLLWERVGREVWRVRAAGAGMIVLAVLIALQEIR